MQMDIAFSRFRGFIIIGCKLVSQFHLNVQVWTYKELQRLILLCCSALTFCQNRKGPFSSSKCPKLTEKLRALAFAILLPPWKHPKVLKVHSNLTILKVQWHSCLRKTQELQKVASRAIAIRANLLFSFFASFLQIWLKPQILQFVLQDFLLLFLWLFWCYFQEANILTELLFCFSREW